MASAAAASTPLQFPTRRRRQYFCPNFVSPPSFIPCILGLHSSDLRSVSLNHHQTSLLARIHMPCKAASLGQVEVEDSRDDEVCELVSGMEISVGDDNYSIRAYLCKAVKNNNGTGIVLLSDIFGFEDSATRDFAYRVACNGYNVLVPDLFRGDPWPKHKPLSQIEPWEAKHTLEKVASDINTCTKWLVDEFLAAGMSSKKLGIIGFCFGGAKVIDILAQDHDTCFGVGVSFYGARINPSVAHNIKVPVLLVSGDEDPYCEIKTLEDVEKRIGNKCEVLVFRGRGHGFVHRPESPEEDEDAEQAFMVMRNWLQDGFVAGT